MCLWDFVTHVDKQRIGRQREEEYEADEQMGNLEYDERDSMNEMGIKGDMHPPFALSHLYCEHEAGNFNFISKLINDVSHTQPIFQIESAHIGSHSHQFVICHL